MRKLVGIALLGFFLGIGTCGAYADTITTGNLAFATFGNPSPMSPLPTGGSFAYDNTTEQFLSFTTTWDGMTFDLASGATQADFLALTDASATPHTWSGICIPSTVNPTVPCDGSFGFSASVANLLFGQTTGPLTPTVGFAEAAGTFTATQIVTTPEPGAVGLLALGIGLVLALGNRKPAFDRKLSAPSRLTTPSPRL